MKIKTREDLSAMMATDLLPFGSEFDYLIAILEDSIGVKHDLDYARSLVEDWDDECRDLIKRMLLEGSVSVEIDEAINAVFN